MVDFFFQESPVVDDAAWAKATKDDWATPVLQAVRASYAACEWTHDTLKSVLEEIGNERGLKLGKTQAPIRVAVTGRSVGPPLFESLEILGRERTMARIDAALDRLTN